MSVKHYLALLIYFLTFNSFAQNWNINEIGIGNKAESFDLLVGDARNDNTQRIYVSTKNNSITEWTYNKTTKKWNKNIVMSNLNGLVMIEMGMAKNDNKNRLYATEFADGGNVWELAWDGSKWISNQIDTGFHSLSVVVGNGRNDGKNYLYVGSTNKGTWEYAWDKNKWIKTQIHFQASEGVGLVGDSKNDNTQRLIFTSDKVKEYTWNGSKYTFDSPSPKVEWPDAIHIGQGRNDGINRIYANCFANRGRMEYTWNGSSWTETIMNPNVGRGDIYTAAVKADGKTRVYTTTSKYFKGNAGPFQEYTWNGSSKKYDKSVILDAKSGATAMIYAGYGRNDDTARIYATNYVAGSVYEITSKTPFVKKSASINPIDISSIDLNIYPNPSKGFLNLEINNPKNLNITVDLVNYMGNIIKKINEIGSKGWNQKINTTNYSRGIYYLRIEIDGKFIVKQVALL